MALVNQAMDNDMRLKEVKNVSQDIPTASFSSWLSHTRRMQITEEGVNMPCGECNVCCTSSYFIHIKPDETQTLTRIPKGLLFTAPGFPKGCMVLGYDENGHCPMFIDNKCSIYDHRPLTCRNYDCRIFSATGLDAGDNKELISQQARRWKFDFSTEQDRNQFSAVQAAVKFIKEHAESFPAEFVPSNTTQQAVLAIKVYEVFLPSGNVSQNIEQADMNRKIVEAVLAAYENFYD
jgi:uncharacterized protein